MIFYDKFLYGEIIDMRLIVLLALFIMNIGFVAEDLEADAMSIATCMAGGQSGSACSLYAN